MDSLASVGFPLFPPPVRRGKGWVKSKKVVTMALIDSLYHRALLDSLKFGDKATIKKNLALEKLAWDSLCYMNV